MRYLKEREKQRHQQKTMRQEQNRFKKAQQNMAVQQISCRFIPHCKNAGNKQLCMRCKRNSTGMPQKDYFKPKIPGIKILP